MSDPRFYFWFACERGDTLWLETETRQPPVGWEALRCRYCGTPLRAISPMGVTG